VQVELGGEALRRHRAHPRVVDAGQPAAQADDGRAHAEPVQGLAQLQADHPGADHQHAPRQRRPVEHPLVVDQLRQPAQRRRHEGA
jgi:hypothetical protein